MTSMTADLPRADQASNDFIPSDFQPPFLLRFGSVIIDYIVLLILPITGLLSEKLVGGTGFGIFSDRTIWLFAVIFAGLNVVILPLISSQTAGMMLTGIRIVNRDGSTAGRGAVLARQTFGYLVTLGTLGLGFLISAVNTSGRTLHDFLTGTALVRARKRIVSI